MPKPQIYPIKKLIAMNRETAKAISAFQKDQSPKISENEAMRQLMQKALTDLGYLQSVEQT